MVHKRSPPRYGDDDQLAALGHRAELKRSFSPLAMLGLAFAILNSWTALAASLSLALPSGGPVSVIWGLVAAGICNLCLAASLAEFLSLPRRAGGARNAPRATRRRRRVMADLHAVDDQPQLQLTLDVYEDGKPPKRPDGEPEKPAVATLSVSGKLEEFARELYQDEPVVITIADRHGTVVASGQGLTNIGFKRKTTKDLDYLERQQKVKLG